MNLSCKLHTIYESQAHLDADLAYWQEQLRLQDWRVKAEVVRDKQMRDAIDKHSPSSGGASVLLDRKEATILLLHPADFPSDTTWPQDHEVTLVHELLHLHLEAIFWACPLAEKTDSYTNAEEQAICSIAPGLVQLRRGSMPDRLQ